VKIGFTEAGEDKLVVCPYFVHVLSMFCPYFVHVLSLFIRFQLCYSVYMAKWYEAGGKRFECYGYFAHQMSTKCPPFVHLQMPLSMIKCIIEKIE